MLNIEDCYTGKKVKLRTSPNYGEAKYEVKRGDHGSIFEMPHANSDVVPVKFYNRVVLGICLDDLEALEDE